MESAKDVSLELLPKEYPVHAASICFVICIVRALINFHNLKFYIMAENILTGLATHSTLYQNFALFDRSRQDLC